jgi:hypothetical protein
MPETDGASVGNIRDLTEQVIVRTIDALRTKLAPSEITALEALATAGTFLDSAAVLSSIAQVQASEAK